MFRKEPATMQATPRLPVKDKRRPPLGKPDRETVEELQMMKTLLAAATLAVLSAPALAQTPTAPAPEKSMAEQAFAKHDADKSGSLSLTEVQTIDAKITQADFDAYDGDKNKSLTVAEFSKWVEAKTTPPASKPG